MTVINVPQMRHCGIYLENHKVSQRYMTESLLTRFVIFLFSHLFDASCVKKGLIGFHFKPCFRNSQGHVMLQDHIMYVTKYSISCRDKIPVVT